METQTIQFRIGSELGIRLMEIAQEHFFYDNNINKALSVFDESFGDGCPKEMQLKLLSGEMVILVDEEKQEFNVVNREAHHDSVFPKINFENYFNEKQREFDKTVRILRNNITEIGKKFKYQKNYDFKFPIESVVKFIYGDSSDMIAEIEDDYILNVMKTTVKVAYDFIATSIKLQKLAKQVKQLYPELNIDFDNYKINEIDMALKDIIRNEFILFGDGDEIISNYIEATKEIHDVIAEGIKPVNILSGYDAGWLSPDGKYYALNGEIANMLHNNIADALYKVNVIPDGIENEQNPERWLNENGWVRIHKDWILYDGYYGKREVPITKKQIESIERYGQTCCKGMLKVGIEQTPISAAMFGMIEPLQFKLKFFKI